MTEDATPYTPMNKNAELIDEREVQRRKHLEDVNLEISKIQNLPAAYWPNEWRKHLERVSVTALALIRLMSDVDKGHALDKRTATAVNELKNIFSEMESAMYDVNPVNKPDTPKEAPDGHSQL
jgi:hypothetical protein